jgi:hypothetical protein
MNSYSIYMHKCIRIGNINAERANLLADLAGWSVLQNEEEFRRMLS